MLPRIKEILDKEEIKYSLYIKNLVTKEVMQINEREIVPSASIIKLFIMGYIFEMVNRGVIRLEDRIAASKDHRVDGGIISLLSHENSYTLKDLITLMIVESDNTATNLLIDLAGMDDINSFINTLGFKDTRLQRKMMDFEGSLKGWENYTTAFEVGGFLEALYMGNIISMEYSKLMVETMKNQRDSRMMRREIPDKVIIAHKTGDLPNLNHDAGIIFGDSDYIFVMFTWDGRDNMTGRRLIGEVAKRVYEYFNKTMNNE